MRNNAQSAKTSLTNLLTIGVRLVPGLVVEEVDGHAQVVRRIQQRGIRVLTLDLDRSP